MSLLFSLQIDAYKKDAIIHSCGVMPVYIVSKRIATDWFAMVSTISLIYLYQLWAFIVEAFTPGVQCLVCLQQLFIIFGLLFWLNE